MKQLKGARTITAGVGRRMGTSIAIAHCRVQDIPLCDLCRSFQGVVRRSISGRGGKAFIAGEIRECYGRMRKSWMLDMKVGGNTRDIWQVICLYRHDEPLHLDNDAKSDERWTSGGQIEP